MPYRARIRAMAPGRLWSWRSVAAEQQVGLVDAAFLHQGAGAGRGRGTDVGHRLRRQGGRPAAEEDLSLIHISAPTRPY